MIEDYLTLEKAFDFYNKQLFSDTLKKIIITLQRKGKTYGYFSPNRFQNKTDKKISIDEIALNPDHFERNDELILSTLVHEMCHLWQSQHGEKYKPTVYHNKEWVIKMEQVGLIPSNTGAEGGKKTGQCVSHYIDKNGLFKTVTDKMLSEYKLNWKSFQNPKKEKAKTSKMKFTCSSCGQNAWAKESAQLKCGECDIEMEVQE
jgi:predicted SprT family Zn-dependent metalloprotease